MNLRSYGRLKANEVNITKAMNSNWLMYLMKER